MFLSGLKYLRRLERQVKFAKNRCCKIKPVAVICKIQIFRVVSKFNKSIACGCQRSAAAALRNTSGIFDYKQQYYLKTFKRHYHYLVRVKDDPFQKDNKIIFS